jgi:phosphomannomutase
VTNSSQHRYSAVFFINEEGEVIQASLITSLVARELLQKYPGEKVVVDVRNTFNVETAVKKYGGVPVLTRVGHALITQTMKKENALFAGENSGHYFFRETGCAEDPLPVVLTVLSVLAREKKPVSEILKPLSVSFESGEINFETHNAEKIKQTIQEKYKDGKISLLDGLSVDYPDWRFNIRLSNTEPLLRLNLEASDKKLMEEKRDELVELIKRYS